MAVRCLPGGRKAASATWGPNNHRRGVLFSGGNSTGNGSCIADTPYVSGLSFQSHSVHDTPVASPNQNKHHCDLEFSEGESQKPPSSGRRCHSPRWIMWRSSRRSRLFGDFTAEHTAEAWIQVYYCLFLLYLASDLTVSRAGLRPQ